MADCKTILLATDFSDASRHALDWAVTLARSYGAALHAIHVVAPNDDDGAGTPEDWKQAIPADSDDVVTSRETVRALSAELGIVHAARERGADLIVVGTHGRGALAHVLMGSVAERVVQLAHCPVLTVRPPNHDFALPSE